MLHSRLQRRIAWFVLAMYVAAGAAAQLAHDCHGPEESAAHCGALAAVEASSGADVSRAAASRAAVARAAVARAAVARAAGHDDDGCAACRLLGQLSHGFVLPVALEGAALEAPLASLAPALVPGAFTLAPHSRGPPRIV